MRGVNYPYYFLAKALKGIKRHLFLNIVTVVIITFSMAIFGIFSLLFLYTKGVVDRWEERMGISAYLEEGIDRATLKALMDRIRAIDGVEGVRYISKEEAYRLFKRELSSLSDVVEDLDENPLPSSLEVRVRSGMEVEGVERIAREIGRLKGVEDVDFGGQWLKRLATILKLFRVSLVALSLFLFLTIVLIVSNTIRLTMFSRKDEIEIMELVGATERFIKMPFLIEGFLQGTIGAFTGALIVLGLHSAIFPKLGPFFMILSGNPSPRVPMAGLLLFMVLLGGALGIAGSSFAVKRFLEAA